MTKASALHDLSIAEAGRQLRAGAVSAMALTEHALARARALDPKLNAFLLITPDRAIEDAARADREIHAGIDKGPMHGIPYGLKDIFATAGIRTTCHSKLLLDNIPTEDCIVEAKLKAGGGVMIGKLATHEFAFGGPSFDLPFPPARNPWNPEHFTGGSSSGSGAAVAAGIVRMAMGSDTGGSIRGPAFYCGVVGIKPTYGRVSKRGVFPLSFTLDHCGPLTRSVEDAALTLEVIAGHDALDPASADVAKPSFTRDLGRDLTGLKIAYPRAFFAGRPHLSPEVLASIDAAAQQLGRLGADVENVALPDFEVFNACGRIILTAEAYAIHEKDLLTRPMDFGRYTYQRMMLGATLSAADLTQALRLRRELTRVVNEQVLSRFDAIISASAPSPAPRLDSYPKDAAAATPMLTIPFNVTGNPALGVPTGFSMTGLPLGMQIVGRAFDEPTILRIGAAYEAATEWTHKRPPIEAAAQL